MEAPFRVALAALLQVAQAQNRRLLLVGAFARTLCLPESVRGPARKTRDAEIDVVPCGDIERPPGSLPLRRTTRILNTTGLSEAFATARVEDVGGLSLLVPRPEAFVLLKLLSFLDRRAPRDL